MDWNQSTCLRPKFSNGFADLRYGISRTAGTRGFARPPNVLTGLITDAVPDPFVEHIVDLRHTSRKIPQAEKFGSAPARRTIRIFERHDLITKKRRRSGKPGHPGKPLTPMDEPNAVWTVDFGACSGRLLSNSCSSAEACIPHRSSSPSLYSSRLSASSLPAVIRSDNGTPSLLSASPGSHV